MIIANGTIEVKTITDTAIEYDEFGIPNESGKVAKWGSPIECQYRAVNLDYVAVTNDLSPHTLASYEILIEDSMIPFDAVALRLRDKDGNEVEEFSIVRMIPIDAVSQIKIVV